MALFDRSNIKPRRYSKHKLPYKSRGKHYSAESKRLFEISKELLTRIWLFCSWCPLRQNSHCEGYDKKLKPYMGDARGFTKYSNGFRMKNQACELLDVFRDYKFQYLSGQEEDDLAESDAGGNEGHVRS